jgi:hypothetical protein
MRWVALFAGFWATAVAPALCISGVLQHGCDPHHANDCQHESGCEQDPCSQVAKAQEKSQPGPLLDLSPLVAAVVSHLEITCSESHCLVDVEPPREPKLPFAPSDVPLLV